MARLSFRCDEELVRLVDAARGEVARERWLRSAVVKAVSAEGKSELAGWSGQTEKVREAADPPLSRTEAFKRATQRA